MVEDCEKRKVLTPYLDRSLEASTESDRRFQSLQSLIKRSIEAAETARDALIHAGGRPRRAVNHNPSSTESFEEAEAISWSYNHFLNEEAYFREELKRWEVFREAQKAVRKDRDTISRTQSVIDRYWRKRGLSDEMRPILHGEMHVQSGKEEWKFFYFLQHQRLRDKEVEVERAMQDAHQALTRRESTVINSVQESYDGVSPLVEALEAGQRWVSSAQLDLSNWVRYLRWIEDELPRIALEEKECSIGACSETSMAGKASRKAEKLPSHSVNSPQSTQYNKASLNTARSKNFKATKRSKGRNITSPKHACKVAKKQNPQTHSRVLRRSLRIAQLTAGN